MRHHPRLLLLHGFCAGRAHGGIRAPASGTCSDRGNGTMHRSAAWIGSLVAGSFAMPKIVLGWHSRVPDSLLLLLDVATIPSIRRGLIIILTCPFSASNPTIFLELVHPFLDIAFIFCRQICDGFISCPIPGWAADEASRRMGKLIHGVRSVIERKVTGIHDHRLS